jgi:hypothetical protein
LTVQVCHCQAALRLLLLVLLLLVCSHEDIVWVVRCSSFELADITFLLHGLYYTG